MKKLPSCNLKDQGIDDFFNSITQLGINIDDRSAGDIRYRVVYCRDEEEGYEVSVAIIQTNVAEVFIIDADFDDKD